MNAGVVVLAGVLLSGFVVGNVFCGWACHFGAAQDFVAAILRRLRIEPLQWSPPRRLRLVLAVKLLVINTVVAWATRRTLPRLAIDFGAPEVCYAIGTVVTVMLDVGVLAVLLPYLFGPRAFCRLLCPLVPLVRLGNAASSFRVRLAGDCVDCGACDRACPMRNEVSTSLRSGGSVVALDCVRCGRCRDACPNGAIELAFGPARARRVLPVLLHEEPRATPAARAPSFSWATTVGALGGLAVFEVYRWAAAARLLPNALVTHLPSWELFYAALGAALGATITSRSRDPMRRRKGTSP